MKISLILKRENGLVLFMLKAFTLLILLNQQICNGAIVNKKAFGSLSCVPYAYGDFNADKLVDIYCVSQPGKCEISYTSEINIFLKLLNISFRLWY